MSNTNGSRLPVYNADPSIQIPRKQYQHLQQGTPQLQRNINGYGHVPCEMFDNLSWKEYQMNANNMGGDCNYAPNLENSKNQSPHLRPAPQLPPNYGEAHSDPMHQMMRSPRMPPNYVATPSYLSPQQQQQQQQQQQMNVQKSMENVNTMRYMPPDAQASRQYPPLMYPQNVASRIIYSNNAPPMQPRPPMGYPPNNMPMRMNHMPQKPHMTQPSQPYMDVAMMRRYRTPTPNGPAQSMRPQPAMQREHYAVPPNMADGKDPKFPSQRMSPGLDYQRMQQVPNMGFAQQYQKPEYARSAFGGPAYMPPVQATPELQARMPPHMPQPMPMLPQQQPSHQPMQQRQQPPPPHQVMGNAAARGYNCAQWASPRSGAMPQFMQPSALEPQVPLANHERAPVGSNSPCSTSPGDKGNKTDYVNPYTTALPAKPEMLSASGAVHAPVAPEATDLRQHQSYSLRNAGAPLSQRAASNGEQPDKIANAAENPNAQQDATNAAAHSYKLAVPEAAADTAAETGAGAFAQEDSAAVAQPKRTLIAATSAKEFYRVIHECCSLTSESATTA